MLCQEERNVNVLVAKEDSHSYTDARKEVPPSMNAKQTDTLFIEQPNISPNDENASEGENQRDQKRARSVIVSHDNQQVDAIVSSSGTEDQKDGEQKKRRRAWDFVLNTNVPMNETTSSSLAISIAVTDRSKQSPVSQGSPSSIPKVTSELSPGLQTIPTACFPSNLHVSSGLSKDQLSVVDCAKRLALGLPRNFNNLNIPSSTGLHTVDPRNVSILCRIYVGNISFESGEADVRALFEPFGCIRQVNLAMELGSGRHKGFCFIEYETADAAFLALDTMSGAHLTGRQLRVGRPNNYPGASVIASLPPSVKERVYISAVHPAIGEKDLESVFEAFGKIRACVLIPNPPTGLHKGYGFIEYENEQSATMAIASMNGFSLGGMQLRIGKSIVGGPLPPGMSSLGNRVAASTSIGANSTSQPNPLNAARAVAATLTRSIHAHSAITSVSSTNTPSFSATEDHGSLVQEENVTISSYQRYQIMQKLARNTDLAPSQVIMLCNMIMPEEVDGEFESEIRAECDKYGHVEGIIIHINEKAQDVRVFVKYREHLQCTAAINALNGRWFGGRRVRAEIYDARRFELHDYEG